MHTDEEKQLRLKIIEVRDQVLKAKLRANSYSRSLLMKELTVPEIVNQLHQLCLDFSAVLTAVKSFLELDYWRMVVIHKRKAEMLNQRLRKNSIFNIASHFKQLCEQTECKKMQSYAIQATFSQLYSAIEHAKLVTADLNLLSLDNKDLTLQVQTLRVEIVSGFELLRSLHIQSDIALSEYARRQLPNNVTLQEDDKKRLKEVEELLCEEKEVEESLREEKDGCVIC